MDPYAPDSTWLWDQIAQPEAQGERRQAIWWSDTVVALILRAALRQLPVNPGVRAKAQAAAQVLKNSAGVGTLDVELLNADHGVLLIADTILQQPWVQEQCEHFQAIIVNSRGKHFITYFRKTGLLANPGEQDGAVWLQELKAKRPLVEVIRPEEPNRTTRSAGQPQQHLVVYTNPNKVKLAIISNSPDQEQYEDSAKAWRRIFKHSISEPAPQPPTTEPERTPLPTEPTTMTRKRGRPVGSKNSSSKPKAIRGIKLRRIDLTPPHWTNTQSMTPSKTTRLKGKQTKCKSNHRLPSALTTAASTIAGTTYVGNSHNLNQDDNNNVYMHLNNNNHNYNCYRHM